MELWVKGRAGSPEGVAELNGTQWPCLLGRNGVIAEDQKREGDGCTPLGTYTLLNGLYRPDRVAVPAGPLMWQPLNPTMGWCDAPTDPRYNQPVPAGYAASHEELWRTDSAYDLIGVLNHNTPAVPHRGSAVFLHVWDAAATHTAGCVALKIADLQAVLAAGVTALTISHA